VRDPHSPAEAGDRAAHRWQRLAGDAGRARPDQRLATPSADQLRQFDRTRPHKRVSNADWVSPVDPQARIARLKDGRTRSAYKPEHAVDLDSGATLAAAVHPGDAGDTRTLELAASNLETLELAPVPEAPAEVVADKGHHSREALKRLDHGPVDDAHRRACPADPAALARRCGSPASGLRQPRPPALGVARVALMLRAVLCEWALAHLLDRGAMRRSCLRGRENVAKRYLIQVAAFNLGPVMRALFGAGHPESGGRPPPPLAHRRGSRPARADRVQNNRIDRHGHTRCDRNRHHHTRRPCFINGLLAWKIHEELAGADQAVEMV
jgi:hypothetical protein